MINLSFFITLLGINQSFYFLKYGFFFLFGLFNFKRLNKEINILFILMIIFCVIVQNDYAVFFKIPKLNNFHAYSLFETIIFPYLLAQIAFNLARNNQLNLIFVARLYVIINLFFIALQVYLPELGYFLYANNIFEYPRLQKNIAYWGMRAFGVQPGISSSQFYMSAYMSMLLPIAVGKYWKRISLVSFRTFILLVSYPVSLIGNSRGLLVASIYSLTRSKFLIVLIGSIPFFLIMLLYKELINLNFINLKTGDIERMDYFFGGFELFYLNPLGTSELLVFSDIYRTWPHNFFITYAIKYGIDFIFVLIYLIFLVRKFEHYIIIGILGAFISGLYHNMAPFFLNWPFMVIVGYGIGEYKRNLFYRNKKIG